MHPLVYLAITLVLGALTTLVVIANNEATHKPVSGQATSGQAGAFSKEEEISAGLFGTRIRVAADFDSYIPELTAEKARIVGELTANPQATNVAEALRDAKTIASILDFNRLVLTLQTVLSVYKSTHPEFAAQGQVVLETAKRLQIDMAVSSSITSRVDACLTVLRAELTALKDKPDADTSVIAEVELALFNVDDVWRSFQAVTFQRSKLEIESTPLDQVPDWEKLASVSMIRTLWSNTADSVGNKFGKRKYIEEHQVSDIRVSLLKTIECAALALKSFLGVTLRLDEAAFQIDEYSFTLNVFENNEVIGIIHLHADIQEASRVSFSPMKVGYGKHFRSVMSVGRIALNEEGIALSEEGAAVTSYDSPAPVDSSPNSSEGSLAGQKSGASASAVTASAAVPAKVSQTKRLEQLEVTSAYEFEYVFHSICSDVGRFLEKREAPLMWLQASSPLNRAFAHRLFALWARDFMEAIDDGSAEQIPVLRRKATLCGWRSFFTGLESAATIAVTTVKFGSEEVARVLGTTVDHSILVRAGKGNKGKWPLDALANPDYHLQNPLATALAVTVYARDRHRNNIFDLYSAIKQESRAEVGQGVAAAAATRPMLRSSSVARVDYHSSSLSNSNGLRQFFLPDLRPGVSRSMRQVLPDLLGSTNAEDLVNWEALIIELISQVDLPE